MLVGEVCFTNHHINLHGKAVYILCLGGRRLRTTNLQVSSLRIYMNNEPGQVGVAAQGAVEAK